MSEREPVRRNFVVAGTVAFDLIVLAVFMYFVFPPGRETDHRPSLLSKVKQQALGVAMYKVDYDSRFPLTDKWADAVLPYISDKSAFEDYTIKERKKDEFGFAFFRPLSGLDDTTLSDIEKLPLTFQSKDLTWNANGLLDLLPNRYEARRGAGNAISFVDTHVKFMPESWPVGPITIVIGASQDQGGSKE